MPSALTLSDTAGGEGRRGFTLLETLMAATLALLVLGVLLGFLVAGLRAFARGSSRAEIQQQGMAALSAMAEDLRATAPGAVTAHASPPVSFALTRAAGLSPDGKMWWEPRVVVYYHDARGRGLVRKTWPPAPPTLSVPTPTDVAPALLSPDNLAAVAESCNGTERRLASNVDAMTVTGVGTTRSPITLHLDLSRPGGASRPETVSLSVTVTLRESL